MLSQRIFGKKTDRYGIIKKCKKEWIEEKQIKYMCSQYKKEPLDTPMNRGRKRFSEKVSFCTLTVRQASLTLETAMVLPLFLLGMMTMISFMDIYRLQTVHFSRLCQNAMQAGMLAYGTSGNGPEELTLPDVYSYEPLGGLLPLRKIWTYNQVKVHTWTGRDASSWEISDSDEMEEMVFVTASGGVCHLDANCSYLKLSVSSVSGSTVSSLRNANGEKYHACEICSRNQQPSGTVYITKDGNRYHNHPDCSGLKRTVRLVCRSDVSQMNICSRCGHSHAG